MRTLNHHGFMSTRIDAYMEAFLTFAKTSPAPVVDIGAAYGVATIAALQTGATVVAVDVEERHLEILARRVPRADRKRLRTIRAAFPEELRFERRSIGAFLLANVVHFLSPERLQFATRRLFEWAIAGGKVFVTAASPYLADFRSFVPEYEARRRAGEAWPGYLTDVPRYAPVWKDERASLLLLDPETLSRAFREAGFVVEKAELFARPDLPPARQLDGREGVGLIAQVPDHAVSRGNVR